MIDLDQLSRSELVALNREIVARIKQMDAHAVAKDMVQFRPGDQVSFEARDGTVLGRVMKLNRKTISILAEDGCQWNVSPHALKPVKNAQLQRPIIEGDRSSD